MVDFKTLDDLDASGKTVLVRVDLNVPVENGKIADFTRIDRIRPTLDELADKGAIVLLLSHFGRPKGKAVPEMSLRPIAEGLSDHIGKPVTFIEDCIGEPVKKALKDAKAGDILLAENVRYHAGEEKNDADFAKTLAAAGDVYVNDAFSCSHRAHASTEAIAHLLPAYA
ncbi:phosphoglycerate kinase, partial [uncultured Sneathiella sp.]